MYQRNIPRLPKIISREAFVDRIFDLGQQYQHGYDTIMTAVEIGDFFITYKGKRVSHLGQFSELTNQPSANTNSVGPREPSVDLVKENQRKLMIMCVPQVYSEELAYVVTVISACANEDHNYSYSDIVDAASEVQNGYVYKMQWEICAALKFYVRPNNVITLLGRIIWAIYAPKPDTNNIYVPHMGTTFWDLARTICMKKSFLSINPITIVIGAILLQRHGKLRPIRENRERRLITIMNKLAREYEVSLADLVRVFARRMRFKRARNVFNKNK